MEASHRDLPRAPVDYLILGHVTQDQTPDGPRLGGTAAYASLTATNFGLRVGIVTSAPDDFPLLTPLAGLQVIRIQADQPTTFENIYGAGGNRQQFMRARAADLPLASIPPAWQRAPIVHLAPLANEISTSAPQEFPNALLGVTPQGWLRTWDEEGRIHRLPIEEPAGLLDKATAVVLSIEDLNHDEKLVSRYAVQSRLLVVTRGAGGCSVHWRDDWRHFPAPVVANVDPTGSGDIFAAAFFYRLHVTRGDPYEAARFATQIASTSVTRTGIEGVPTLDEIQQAFNTVS